MAAPTDRLSSPVTPPTSTAATPNSATDVGEELIAASTPFVGRWQTLVSTTNWEKGQIILDWRNALIEEDAPVTDYSDEAWATLVGNVTSQHVGRLRRVYERFAEVNTEYEGLYWSHFQAALDWQDAEMWLEGGVQNGWSVSQMRAKRWETVGDGSPAPEEDRMNPAADEEIDFSASDAAESSAMADVSGDSDSVSAKRDDNDSAGDSEGEMKDGYEPIESGSATPTAAEKRDPVRPFAGLKELPDDLADAFEQFKLAIITHRLTEWSDVTVDDVLASLDSLKELASSPLEDKS